MGTQVNNLTGKQALQAVKAYVDKQATAQVIRTETTLWSGTGRTGQTLTLSSSIQNYDEIIIYAVKDNSEDMYRQWQAATVKVSDIVLGKGVIFYIPSGNSANDWARITFSTNTSVAVAAAVPSSASYNTITKITGIKYTVPETYSTNEQIVGTWIDGKALYRRVIEIPEVQAVDRNWTLLLTDPTFLNTIDKLISAKFLTPIGTHLPLDTKIQDGKFYLWVYPGGDRINTIIIEYTKTGGA